MGNGEKWQLCGDSGEQALKLDLERWYGRDTNVDCRPAIAELGPDRQGVDLTCAVRTVPDRPASVHFRFQVKTTNSEPSKSLLYQELAYKVPINPATLDDALTDDSPFFLVLGVPIEDAPEARHSPPICFEWYAVELHRFVERYRASDVSRRWSTPTEIHVPSRNRLNAAVAALLWGSWWSHHTFERLWCEEVECTRTIAYIRDRYLKRNISECRTVKEVFDIDDTPLFYESLSRVSSELARHLSLIVGSAYAVLNIQRGIFSGHGTSYRSFASEAACEEVNFWLFYKFYRDHLGFSRDRINNVGSLRYVRFLPIPDPCLMPTHLLLAHVFAARVHRFAKITSVLERINDTQNVLDRIHIGSVGSIVSRFVGSGDWDVRVDSHGAASEDTDFFQEHLRHLSNLQSLIDNESLMLATRLPSFDRELPTDVPPVDLFAPEGSLLQYPMELWNGGHDRISVPA